MEASNYNSLLRMTGLKRLLGSTILALLIVVAPCYAGNWNSPAGDLAKAIVTASGPGTITLTVSNASSIGKSDLAEIQKTIEAQLRTGGVRVVSSANVGTDVHVTLSENLEGYLWVAEIKQGNQSRVEMIQVPRTEEPAIPHSGPSVTIRRTLLWSQPTQILDAYLTGSRMVLLDADAVSSFTMNSGKWQPENSLAIVRGHNFPRDLRGLLVPARDHLADIYLPGTVCNATVSSTNAIACHDGDDPWPLGTHAAFFNSGRNYFTGALVPASAKSVAPFYSMISLDHPGYSLSVFTSVDGRVRLSDGVNERSLTATTSDWGSDLATVKSQCGDGTQILVTSAGDDTTTDSLRAFEIPDREPIQVSAALDFLGPITALWTHGDTATAVAHNLRTGSYEAYSVSVTCNQ